MSTNVKNQASKDKKVAKKDVAILDLIAEDHPGSFEMLIEKYGNLVWSIGKKFLGNQSDLEDAVQEVLIAIWKSAGKFDPSKASEITFVSMIARRRFIDYLRKITKHKSEDSMDDDNNNIQLEFFHGQEGDKVFRDPRVCPKDPEAVFAR